MTPGPSGGKGKAFDQKFETSGNKTTRQDRGSIFVSNSIFIQNDKVGRAKRPNAFSVRWPVLVCQVE